ncbi:MAG TPA: allophanate hydrolase [Solirubrobacteraceae bacterium]|nr:allophanate hydrolase [Solirubrobacteraceae bacterium]
MPALASSDALSAPERVHRAYRRIEVSDRPEAWIELRDEHEALAEAAAVQRRLGAGARLPLAGVTVAVKDNVDVAGLPTTAGCPAYAYTPPTDAESVARLRAAGAIVLGKANLDQFATGLTGTRSPYGAVRDARDPDRVAGGSSSGSAVAVATGMADLGLGTDTAGSGRVPAAFQGVVGIKPTLGLVPTRGVVPACRSFDCVSVFAATLALARGAIAVMAGHDAQDPRSRRLPGDAPAFAPERPRIAVPRPEQLELLSPDALVALATAAARCQRTLDAELVEIDLEPFLTAGRLLYEGAFVAERFAAVGEFIASHREAVDPHVATIVLGGGGVSAASYVGDVEKLERLRLRARDALRGCDTVLLPTAPFQPTIEQVRADPIGCNRRLGTYTTFANLLDLCAVALPAGHADGGCFGITLLAPSFRDDVLADLAGRLELAT